MYLHTYSLVHVYVTCTQVAVPTVYLWEMTLFRHVGAVNIGRPPMQ
jgi:hypothetical protein